MTDEMIARGFPIPYIDDEKREVVHQIENDIREIIDRVICLREEQKEYLDKVDDYIAAREYNGYDQLDMMALESDSIERDSQELIRDTFDTVVDELKRCVFNLEDARAQELDE